MAGQQGLHGWQQLLQGVEQPVPQGVGTSRACDTLLHASVFPLGPWRMVGIPVDVAGVGLLSAVPFGCPETTVVLGLSDRL